MPRILYQDADTGELIPEDQYNPNDYELAGEAQQVQEPGFWENLGRQAAGGFGRFVSGVGNAAEDALHYVSDTLDQNVVNEGLKSLGIYRDTPVSDQTISGIRAVADAGGDLAGVVGKEMGGFAQDITAPTRYVNPYSLKGVTGTVGGGLAEFALPLLTGNPAALGTLYGTSRYGQNLNAYEQEGATREEARQGAMIDAPIQGTLAIIPGVAAFKQGTRFLPRLAQTILGNEALALGGIGSNELGRREAGLEPQDPSQLLEQAKQTVLPTAIMSVPMAAGGHVAQGKVRPAEAPIDTSVTEAPPLPIARRELPDYAPKKEPSSEPVILQAPEAKPSIDGDMLVKSVAPKPLREQIVQPETTSARNEQQISESQKFLQDLESDLEFTRQRLKAASDAKYGVGKAPPPLVPILEPTQTMIESLAPQRPGARSPELQAELQGIRESGQRAIDGPKRATPYQEPAILPQGPLPSNASEGGILPPTPHTTWKDILTREEGFWKIFNDRKKDNVDEVASEPLRYRQQKESPDQANLRGLFGQSQKEIPVLSRALSGYRRVMPFMSTLAEKYPAFKPVYEVAQNLQKSRSLIPSQLRAKASAFYDLPAAKREQLRDYLFKTREFREKGGQIDESPETLKAKGWTDRDIAGLQAVRGVLDDGLELFRNGLLEEAKLIQDIGQREQYVAKVNRFIDQKRAEGYVPRSRFGDYKLEFEGADGRYNFELFESKGHLKSRVAELNQQGITPTTGRLRGLQDEAYAGMNADLMSQIMVHDANVKNGVPTPPVEGFKGHLLESKNVPGYSLDLDRALADYANGAANFYSSKAAKVAFEQSMQGIDKTSPLYGQAARLRDYVLNSDSEWSGIRQLMSVKYLGANVKSGFMNGFGGVMNGAATLARYTKNPEKKMLSAMNRARKYMWDSENFAKSEPELAQALKVAFQDGTLQDNATRNLSALARGSGTIESLPEAIRKFGAKEGLQRYKEGKLSTLKNRGVKAVVGESYNDAMKAMMYPFGVAEEFARASSFIAAFDVAKESQPNLSVADRVKFAENFVNKTQFILDKYNRPEIARGKVGSNALLFKLYGGNWLRLLRDNFKESKPAFARQLGYTLAAAGMVGLPGFNILMRSAEWAGMDVKGATRDAFKYISDKLGAGNLHESAADVFLYGGFEPFGIHATGSLGFGEVIPSPDAASYESALKTFGGVPASAVIDSLKAVNNYRRYGSKSRLIEDLSPEFLSNAMEAYRWTKDGARTHSGEPLIENPSVGQTLGKLLGFYPSEISKAYEERRSLMLNKEAGRDNDNINWRFADALRRGDDERLKAIIEEAAGSFSGGDPSTWKKIDKKAVKDSFLMQTMPEIYHLKTTPDKMKPGALKIQGRFPSRH